MVDPLQLLSPSHLLLSVDATATIVTNYPSSDLHMSMNACTESLVHITRTTVRAGSVVGEGTIVVSLASNPLQRVVVHISVVQPTFLRFSLAPTNTTTPPFHVFTGTVSSLHVQLLDSQRQVLNGIRGLEPDVLSNHHGRASVSWDTVASGETKLVLGVAAVSTGPALVRVAVGGVKDFVEVTVEDMITPSAAVVHVGSEISYSTRIPAVGTWSVSNDSLVDIDHVSGVAQAHEEASPGQAATVWFRNADVSTSTEITIARVAGLDVSGLVLSPTRKTLPRIVRFHLFADALKTIPFSESPNITHHLVIGCELFDRKSGAKVGYCDVIREGDSARVVILDHVTHLGGVSLHTTIADKQGSYPSFVQTRL